MSMSIFQLYWQERYTNDWVFSPNILQCLYEFLIHSQIVIVARISLINTTTCFYFVLDVYGHPLTDKTLFFKKQKNIQTNSNQNQAELMITPERTSKQSHLDSVELQKYRIPSNPLNATLEQKLQNQLLFQIFERDLPCCLFCSSFLPNIILMAHNLRVLLHLQLLLKKQVAVVLRQPLQNFIWCIYCTFFWILRPCPQSFISWSPAAWIIVKCSTWGYL